MPTMLIIDTWYPAMVARYPLSITAPYVRNLDTALSLHFGTSDFYSRNLRRHGWDCQDVIANHPALQTSWARDHGMTSFTLSDVLDAQIRAMDPEVIFFQDLSFDPDWIGSLKKSGRILAGQCSCPMPAEANIKAFDVIFTSFPHYVEEFAKVGVRGVYNPLGFEAELATMFSPHRPRFRDCVFVGGVGWPSHWTYGIGVLTAIAEGIPETTFWGYGYDTLPPGHPVRQRYVGAAWGIDMYDKFATAKIVVNRHGEVAGPYANNMRMFEATGMGALLVTDKKDNMGDFFEVDECVTYDSPEDAVEKIRYYLDHWWLGVVIASRGQQRTLRDHTYERRMKTVSDTLKEML